MNNFIAQLNLSKNSEIRWLTLQLQDNKELIEIGYGYQDMCNYDGNIYSDTISALFEAYCQYKNNILLSQEDAMYLLNRSGILYSYPNQETGNTICLTVKQLIKLYEKNNLFEEWLKNIAEDDVSLYL